MDITEKELIQSVETEQVRQEDQPAAQESP
jgi:hypothetical protein